LSSLRDTLQPRLLGLILEERTVRTSVFIATLLGVAALVSGCGGSVNDPASAACPRPPTTFGSPVLFGDHSELAVHFTCSGARLAGTLYLPLKHGRHPAVVWLHGSGEEPRLSYGPLVASYIGDGIALFSYDKRGVGESQGKCCPDVDGHFNFVTADAVGAVAAILRSHRIDTSRIGFLGASAAGWVAPRAAETSKHVAFLAIASPGVLQHSVVANYEQFAGGSESTKPRPSEAEIAAKVKELEKNASGFDPRPYLIRLNIPALWLIGGADRNIPPVQSAAALRSIKRAHGKDWTIVTFPGAGHGLFDTPPTDPRAAPIAEAWVRRHVGD
jgi:alpha-beta hydrolase superfamily lysophospholipase